MPLGEMQAMAEGNLSVRRLFVRQSLYVSHTLSAIKTIRLALELYHGAGYGRKIFKNKVESLKSAG